MTELGVPCGVCAASIPPGDKVCPGCGRALTDQDRVALRARAEAGDHIAYSRGKQMRKASKWIGALAILFAVSGVFYYFVTSGETQKALQHLAQFEDDDVLEPIDGKTYTAGQLRAEVRREPYQVLVTNLVVAGLMGVLWAWAKRTPLPAIACACALVVAVYVVSGVIDPSTIPKGLVVKILALVALAKGLKAALAARAAMQRSAA
jgi:hypothetical protein